MANSPSGDSVTARVVRVLEAFDADAPTMPVTEIARRADLPVATAHRLVAELLDLGLLQRAGPRAVRMGTRLWELSVRANRVLTLHEAAMPYMEDLHAVVRQHVSIAVLAGTEVLYVERLSSPGAVPNVSHIGRRLPLHTCSAGLVLLAHAADDVQERVYAGELVAFSPRTITDPLRLRQVVGRVRRHGYAVAPELVDLGVKGVAVPLRDATGAVVAALSIVIPLARDHRPLVPALMATARGINRAMGAEAPAGEEVLRERNADVALPGAARDAADQVFPLNEKMTPVV